MTRSSSTPVFHQSGSPRSGRAVSMSGTVPSAPPFGDGTGPSPLYLVEPEIPEGMTCGEWRRRRQPVPRLGLLAHIGARRRRHRFRGCRREPSPLESLQPIASNGAWGADLGRFERAQQCNRHKGDVKMGRDRRQRRRRAAAIGGAAFAAKKHRDAKEAQRQEEAATAPQAAPAEPGHADRPAAAGGLTPEVMEELKQLGELHEQNVLTDEEFEREKARLLGQG